MKIIFTVLVALSLSSCMNSDDLKNVIEACEPGETATLEVTVAPVYQSVTVSCRWVVKEKEPLTPAKEK